MISGSSLRLSKSSTSAEGHNVEKESTSLVKVSLNESKKIAILTLDRPPVNSLNLELNQAISKALQEIENGPSQALILKSSNPKIFSAGLDLSELSVASTSSDRLEQFWKSFQRVFLDLYSSRISTIAAVEGHAPAGGCMLAMACDYRVMTNQSSATIGLSETKLGIAAPYWLAQLMVNTIGLRRAEHSLGLGILYSPEQALQIGLVDELSPPTNVLETALQQAAQWAQIPSLARAQSKFLTRRGLIEDLKARRDEDLEVFLNFVLRDDVQQHLTSYLERLKKPSK